MVAWGEASESLGGSGREFAGALRQAQRLVDEFAGERQILLRDRERQAIGGLAVEATGTGETGRCIG